MSLGEYMGPNTVGRARSQPARRRARHADGAGTKWRRIRDNWPQLKKLGVNELFGSAIGKLRLFEWITEDQANVLARYGEVVGRFDRYHANPDLRRHAKGASYERGFGSEDEIVRRTNDGTLPAYERRAKRAMKQWKRVQSYVTTDLRAVLDGVCVWDQELPEQSLPALLRAIEALGRIHGFRPHQKREQKAPTLAERAQHMAKVLVDHVHKQMGPGAKVEHFRIVRDDKGDRGVYVFYHRNGKPDSMVAYVTPGAVLPEQLEMVLLKACELKGWREAQPAGP